MHFNATRRASHRGEEHAEGASWNKLEENLPFSESYKASLPKLRKVRFNSRHGSEIVTHVDNVRIVACSEDIAWLTSSRVAKRLCWLGLQDAARKRRRLSQNPGTWVGTVVLSNGDVVTKSVTQERWDKTKEKLRWIAKQGGITDNLTPSEFEGIQGNVESTDPERIHFKTTEIFVGFIVYVAQTYSSFVPYLKGIYLTLNSWRSGRDGEGWLSEEERRNTRLGLKADDGNPPQWVKRIPRFYTDIKALLALTEQPKSPQI